MVYRLLPVNKIDTTGNGLEVATNAFMVEMGEAILSQNLAFTSDDRLTTVGSSESHKVSFERIRSEGKTSNILGVATIPNERSILTTTKDVVAVTNNAIMF